MLQFFNLKFFNDDKSLLAKSKWVLIGLAVFLFAGFLQVEYLHIDHEMFRHHQEIFQVLIGRLQQIR